MKWRSFLTLFQSVKCLFVWQSSGKTYTIGGTDSAGLLEEQYGIILRAVKQLFQIMEVNVSTGKCRIFKKGLQSIM